MMKKVNKYNYKFFIGLIIGIILTLSIGVYAAIKYNATDISYKDKTVKEALDELYKGKEKNSTNIYGVARSMDSSNSSWIRIKDSENLVANPQIGETAVQNDFDNIYPWSDIKSYNYNTDTKEITAWYGESGFTFTPEGNVEVLTYIPEFYYKREQKDNHEYIYITRNNKTGFTKSNAFSVGRYTMSGDETRVHSKSGQPPLVNTNITNFREYARKIDPNYIANDSEYPSEFGQLDYHYFIIQLLYLVEYADYNSQSKLATGNSSNSIVKTSGECDFLGMKSGTLASDEKHSVVYRGMEDIYGNIWQFVDGINIKNRKAYVCYDASKYKSDTFNDVTGDAYNECYKPIKYTNANSDGYISKVGYDENNPLIAFPIAVGGSALTYVPDYSHQTTGNRITLAGGENAGGTRIGFWYYHISSASSNNGNLIGSRLLKID